jgi:hypothetical protein
VAVAFGAPVSAEGDARSRADVRGLTDRIMEALSAQVTAAKDLR